jgi:hypothetical protein
MFRGVDPLRGLVTPKHTPVSFLGSSSIGAGRWRPREGHVSFSPVVVWVHVCRDHLIWTQRQQRPSVCSRWTCQRYVFTWACRRYQLSERFSVACGFRGVAEKIAAASMLILWIAKKQENCLELSEVVRALRSCVLLETIRIFKNCYSLRSRVNAAILV